MSRRTLARLGRRFARDEGGANAIEFAILGVPFIMLLLFGLQIGLYAMTKMALDTGVVKTSEGLAAQFNGIVTPVTPSGAALKASVATNAGGLVTNTSALAVEVRPLSALSSSVTPISDQSTNYGAAHTVLAVRASFVTPTFLPGLSATLTSYSTTLVRRQSL